MNLITLNHLRYDLINVIQSMLTLSEFLSVINRNPALLFDSPMCKVQLHQNAVSNDSHPAVPSFQETLWDDIYTSERVKRSKFPEVI